MDGPWCFGSIRRIVFSFEIVGCDLFSSVPRLPDGFAKKDQKGEKDTGCSQPRAASADRKALPSFHVDFPRQLGR
jgi:hypothetical protein